MTAPLPTTRLPVEDAAFVADPWPRLDALRRRGRLVRDTRSGWLLVTGGRDVEAALRDGRLGRAVPGAPPPGPDAGAFARVDAGSLLGLEGPRHLQLRRALARSFTPAATDRLADGVVSTAQRLVAPLHDGGTVDVVADVGVPLSVGTIAGLLGVGDVDATQLVAWSHAMTAVYEVDADDEVRAAAELAAAAFDGWVREVLADPPDVGVVADLAAARGPDLDDDAVVGLVVMLLNAGHEATVAALALGVSALARHPQQWRRLADGDVDTGDAVEELLRVDPPLPLFHRDVLEPGTEVAGARLDVGTTVGLLLGAVGRDPDLVHDPGALRLDRPPVTHRAFGTGVHACLGAPLARLELRAALGAVVGAAPDGVVVGTSRRRPGFVMRGFERLDVRPS